MNARRSPRQNFQKKLRRRRIVAGLIVLALLVGGGALAFTLFDDDDPSVTPDEGTSPSPGSTASPLSEEEQPTPSENAAEALAGGSNDFVYVQDGEVFIRDLDEEGGEDRSLGRIAFENVVPAGGSKELAYVVTESPQGSPEPVLYLHDRENKSEERIGAGSSPQWDPTGTMLAYLEPSEPEACDASACKGPSRLMLRDPSSQDAEELSKTRSWVLHGWLGDSLLVGDRDSNETLLVAEDGSKENIDLDQRSIWGGSPDGEWLLAEERAGTSFYPVEGSSLGEPIPVPLEPGDDLGAGQWAHDSSRVAAAMSREDGSDVLVTLWPESPAPKLWPGGENASGRLLWSPDNRSLAFVTLNEEEVKLEASLCSVEQPDSCDQLLEWQSGVVILRLE